MGGKSTGRPYKLLCSQALDPRDTVQGPTVCAKPLTRSQGHDPVVGASLQSHGLSAPSDPHLVPCASWEASPSCPECLHWRSHGL